jgi:thioredoxin-related protein
MFKFLIGHKMVNKILIISVFLCNLVLTTFAQKTLPYAFFNGNYIELQAKAQKIQKPYFVYFYANWCMPCKKMNDITFRDAKVIQYLKKYYVGIQIDGESEISEGIDLAKRFEVSFFPMVLFFSPEGKLAEKIDGYLSPTDLMKALVRNQNAKGKPTYEPKTTFDDAEVKAFKAQGKGLYKFHFEPQTSEGYGVQVGTYEDYENVLLKVNQLQKFFHRHIILHIDEEKGKTIYRIILGSFRTRRSAMTYNEMLLRKEGQNGIVVHLATLK